MERMILGPEIHDADLPEWQALMMTRKDSSSTHSGDWRDQHARYWRTYYGNPWSSGDKNWFRRTDRVLANFNYFTATLGAVLGQEMLNRREIQYRGVGPEAEDQQVAHWMTHGTRTQLTKSNFGETCDLTFTDQCIGGWGFANTFIDTTRFPFYIRTETVDPREMFWDPYACSPTLADARYLIHERSWTLEDAVARWPEKERELVAAGTSTDPSARGGFFRTLYDGARRALNTRSLMPPREDHVTLWEYQYRAPIPFVTFLVPQRIDPNSGQPMAPIAEGFEPGQRVEVEASAFEQIEKMWREDPYMTEDVEIVRYPRDIYLRAVVGAPDTGGTGVVLEEPKQMSLDMFSYSACGGFPYRDYDTGTMSRYAFGHLIYEPQLWSSRILSAQVEMLSRGSKGGGFYESGTFEDPAAFEREAAKPGAWHKVNAGFIGRLEERKPMPWPSGNDLLLNLARSAVGEVTNVSSFLKGVSTQERSSLFVSNQQNQQLVALAPIYTPQEMFRVNVARIVGRLMYLYTSPDDINRMLGDDGKVEGLTYNVEQDPVTGEKVEVPVVGADGVTPLTPADYIKRRSNPLDWDIVADTGVATKTEMQQVWANFQSGFLEQLANLDPEAIRLMLPDILESMPVSGDLPKRWAEKLRRLQEQMQQQGQLEGMMQTLQEMPPDQIMQFAQAISPLVQQAQQQMMAQQQQQAPQGGGPPQQPQPGGVQ